MCKEATQQWMFSVYSQGKKCELFTFFGGIIEKSVSVKKEVGISKNTDGVSKRLIFVYFQLNHTSVAFIVLYLLLFLVAKLQIRPECDQIET